ncbi:hypothetical protein J2Z33_000018 [Rubellimicrobium aerolatum]|nr:hypothetical protein [Rubellimicrobium aerolatum]
MAFLAGYRGRILQCDGYGAYDALTGIDRPEGPWVLVNCWTHVRRRFVKRLEHDGSPIAEEALRQIAALYAIEASVRGFGPDARLAARREFSAPIVAAFRPWLEAQLSRLPKASALAEDIRYTLGLWPGLGRVTEDGRLELDTNPVENKIRPIALTRKNALFAGHEVGAKNWAMFATLIASCKTSDVNRSTTSPRRSAPSLTAIRKAGSRSSCRGTSERRQAAPHRGRARRLRCFAMKASLMSTPSRRTRPPF